jgi:hypothetical protein
MATKSETPSVITETPVEIITNAEIYKQMGIPYCDRCGEKFRSDGEGNPMCPVSAADCPRLPKQ